MSSYLEFRDAISATGKTKVLYVYSAQRKNCLGKIAWFGRWRQYTFFPLEDTVWNANCLQEINDKLTNLMREHHDSRRDQS